MGGRSSATGVLLWEDKKVRRQIACIYQRRLLAAGSGNPTFYVLDLVTGQLLPGVNAYDKRVADFYLRGMAEAKVRLAAREAEKAKASGDNSPRNRLARRAFLGRPLQLPPDLSIPGVKGGLATLFQDVMVWRFEQCVGAWSLGAGDWYWLDDVGEIRTALLAGDSQTFLGIPAAVPRVKGLRAIVTWSGRKEATDGRAVVSGPRQGWVTAVRAADGSPLWTRHPGYEPPNLLRPGPAKPGAGRPSYSTSPVLFGNLGIWPWGNNAGLVAYDLGTGRQLWRFKREHDHPRPSRWEAMVAVAPASNRLIYPAEDGVVYGVDSGTGSVRWRQVWAPLYTWYPFSPFASPVVTEGDSGEVAYIRGLSRIEAYEAKTGKLLWSSRLPPGTSALAVSDGALFVTSGYLCGKSLKNARAEGTLLSCLAPAIRLYSLGLASSVLDRENVESLAEALASMGEREPKGKGLGVLTSAPIVSQSLQPGTEEQNSARDEGECDDCEGVEDEAAEESESPAPSERPSTEGDEQENQTQAPVSLEALRIDVDLARPEGPGALSDLRLWRIEDTSRRLLLSLHWLTEGGGGLSLPKDSSGGSFESEGLCTRFLDLAERLALDLQPDYFDLGPECNFYLHYQPKDFERFADVYRKARERVKAVSPATRVLVSFQYELWQGWNHRRRELRHIPTDEGLRTQWGLLEMFGDSLDCVGLASDPSVIFARPDEIPLDYYYRLANAVPGLKVRHAKPMPLIFTHLTWSASDSTNQLDEFLGAFYRRIYWLDPQCVVWANVSSGPVAPSTSASLAASEFRALLPPLSWQEVARCRKLSQRPQGSPDIHLTQAVEGF